MTIYKQTETYNSKLCQKIISVSQAVTHSFHLLLSLATSLASFRVFHPFVSLSLHTVSRHVFFSLSNLPSPYSTHSHTTLGPKI